MEKNMNSEMETGIIGQGFGFNVSYSLNSLKVVLQALSPKPRRMLSGGCGHLEGRMAGCAPSVLRRFRECEDLLLLAGLTNTHQEWLHWAYAKVLVGFYSGYIGEITV